MRPRRSELHRPPRQRLPPHLAHVDGRHLHHRPRVARRRQRLLPTQVPHHRRQIGRTQHRRARHRRRRRRVRVRQDQRPPHRARQDRQRQRPPHRPQPPGQRQLPHQQHLLQRVLRHLTVRRQHADGDRQIEGAPVLAHVRRRQVHHHPLARELTPRGHDRRPHPLRRLPHRRRREPHHAHRRQAAQQVHLHLDGDGLHPLQRPTRDPDRHVRLSPRMGQDRGHWGCPREDRGGDAVTKGTGSDRYVWADSQDRAGWEERRRSRGGVSEGVGQCRTPDVRGRRLPRIAASVALRDASPPRPGA
jgi:hypothetical protein